MVRTGFLEAEERLRTLSAAGNPVRTVSMVRTLGQDRLG